MSEDTSNLQIETTLPKSWEEEVTFNDMLYDWMGRAPWFLLSIAIHGIGVLVMVLIPWPLFGGAPDKVIDADIAQAPEEVFEDPPEEEIEEIEEEEPIEEPILKDAEVSDHNETDDDQPFESSEGDEQAAQLHRTFALALALALASRPRSSTGP